MNSKSIKRVVKELPYIVKRNQINARYLDIPAKKNRVNIFQYHPERFGYDLVQSVSYNLGDSLGEVIIKFILDKAGIDIDTPVSKTKHLNCVGTNIHGSYQDATIWGSGTYPPRGRVDVFLQKLSRRKLDVRAVRGPLTRKVLLELGHKCPEVYGDPAILMPLIYNPKTTEKKREKLVIPQFISERKFREQHPNDYMLSMNTADYQHVIDEIVSSEIVYTSSLHGIILAETYGVPAVFFRGLPQYKDFKYYDWYQSTGRMEITIAENYEEALTLDPQPLPHLEGLVKGLLDSFPYDLWEPKSKIEWQY